MFRSLLENGLKGQKHLAQGSSLGMLALSMAPSKGKSIKTSEKRFCPYWA